MDESNINNIIPAKPLDYPQTYLQRKLYYD